MKTKNVRKPHQKPILVGKNDGNKTMKILNDIAVLEPGKNAQIAAKK